MDGNPYIKILRKLFHDPMWTEERFSKAQAWIDLIHYAFHSDGNFKWDGVRYPLKRGQLCISEEYLAKRWKWSRGRLRRVYKKWQESGMITVQRLVQRSVQQTVQRSIQRKIVVSICKYDEIQFKPRGDGTTVGTTVGQQTVQQKNKRKEQIIRTNFNKPSRQKSEKDIRQSLKNKQHLDKVSKLYQESSV